MAQGIFTQRQQLRGLVQKAWYNNQPILPTLSSYSGSLNGSSQYITWTGNMTGMQFGTGDFTIEAWVNKSANGTNGYDGLMSYGTVTQGGDGWYIECSTNRGLYFSSNSAYFSVASAIANDGLWHHIAVVRASGVLTFYKDGQNIGSTSYTTSIPTSGTIAAIGKSSNGATNFTFNGLISNARIVKGTAVYTSNFNPPTSPLTAIANTQILTLQGPTIVDNSSNSTSLTNNGSVGMTAATVAVNQTVAPSINPPPAVDYLVVAGGGSGGGGGGGAGGLLQGVVPITAGSSLTVTIGAGGNASGSTGGTAGNAGNNSVFGTITAYGGGAAGADNAKGGSGGSGGGPGASSTGFYAGGQGTAGQGNAGGNNPGYTGFPYSAAGGGGAGTVGLTAIAGANFSSNGGAGIASSISGTVTAYAGGGGGGGTSLSSGAPTSVGGIGGGGGGGYSGNGVAGTANTGGGGGGAGGSAYAGNGGSGIVIVSYPDTYNTPAALTGTYTAGTSGSGSFYTNTNSFVYTPSSSSYDLGANNFTLEMWINVSTSNNLIRGVNQYGFALLLSGNTLQYYLTSSNGGWNIASGQGGGTVPFNTWTHIALVRNGNVFTPYVNGLAGATTTSSATLYSNNGFALMTEQPVGSPGGNGLTTGYVSNFRAVIGTAVYTSNFTPSTVPLTAIPNTKVLLNTVSGGYLADSSSLSATMLVGTNTPQWNQLSPFATGLGYKNRVYTWTGSGTVTF